MPDDYNADDYKTSVTDLQPATRYLPARIKPEFEPEETPEQKSILDRLGITEQELKQLLAFKANEEKRSRIWVFMIGVLLMPVTLAGALIGYVRGYNRFMRAKKLLPNFYRMRPIIRFL